MKEKKRYQTPKLTQMQLQKIQDQVFELAEVIVSANYFVIDVAMEQENGRWYLRIYLDHPNPAVRVSLEDCKDISEALSPMIDDAVKELENFPYALEVSSPGLFRNLAQPREFQFYKGRRIEIKPKGEKPFIAYLHAYDAAEQAILYRLSSNEESECTRLHWDAKKLTISLAPDLTENIEIQTVPRRITRYD